MIKTAVGRAVGRNYVSDAVEMNRNILDISRISDELGDNPKYNID